MDEPRGLGGVGILWHCFYQAAEVVSVTIEYANDNRQKGRSERADGTGDMSQAIDLLLFSRAFIDVDLYMSFST